MSVSNECRKGDSIYVIESFISKVVLDNDKCIDLSRSKTLNVGDRVVYLDWSLKSVGDNLFYIIEYRDQFGEELEATETYFVSEEVWSNLERYFEERNQLYGTR
ncbi:hypothetical protein PALU110988_30365 [Paenibacillus lupini]|uniref:hypothetical protein n=1 Tax=Paenibacillus lupini TaxID=1450204 RepID=UPI001420550A|nr:hypothetical protein [Paenibacillus lupini]NIK21603.1 adenylosuccinate lyase [Paenibacillus lupini]